MDNDSQRGSSHHTKRSESFVKLKQSRQKENLLTRDASTRRRSDYSDSGPEMSSRRSLLSNHMSAQGLSRRSMMSSNDSENEIWGADERVDIDEGDHGFAGYDANRQERLIDWNVDILSGLLKQIVAHRKSRQTEISSRHLELENHKPNSALQEITEIIPLSESEPVTTEMQVDPATVDLPPKVESQLREYVTMVACMYRDNPFHNFEHAGHVTMAAQKLLKRVVMADEERVASEKEEAPSHLHDHYARSLSSDPLTQFAIVFSALIHDVDHTGVPNMQLVKEGAHIASLYKNKSVAEQNSLELAWDLLMSPGYKSLQHCIFGNPIELKRFRQLVVNVVIATDIFDPDMKAIRNSRWEKAFCKDTLESPLSDEDDRNLKTTIVIEYIMQASDVSHTMQHWQVYSTWNEKLFEEMYSAYKVNRAEKDPSIGWYNGELWFFDNYIIPLAKKLKECRVFGAASDECLTYALANREQWAKTGEEMVKRFLSKHHNN
jgi:hypothetical protein